MGPDEASHVYRAYEFSKGDLFLDRLSDGQTIGYGYKIPDSIVKLNQDQFWSNAYQPLVVAIKHNLKAPTINSRHTTVQYFEATSVYTPLGYTHFIVVTLLSRALGLSAYISFILLRLSNIALYGFLAYNALKFMPRRKWFLAMVALLPMAIHQATVVSPDGLINGAALLVVALTAKLLVDKKIANRNTLLLLAVALFVVSFAKQAYLLLPFALLLLPKRIFRTFFTKLRYIIVLLVVVWGCLGAWTLVSSASSSAAWNVWRSRENFGQTATTTEFIHDRLRYPLQSIEFIAHSFVYNIAPRDQASVTHPEFNAHNRSANFTWESFLGAFGSLMIGYPLLVYLVVLAGLIIPLLNENYVFLTSSKQRWFVFGLLIAEFGVLALGFWLKWTAKTDPSIVGLQGRYLIPLTGLVVFIPSGKYITLALRRLALADVLASCVLVEGAMLLFLVVSRFYGGL